MTLANKLKKVHGRKHGRPLNAARQRAMDNQFKRYALTPTELTCDGTLEPRTFFPDATKLSFEVGFGNGDFLFEMMQRHPSEAFFAAEPYVNGMSALMKHIDDTPCEDGQYPLKVWMDDAMDVAKSLTDGSLDCIYVLNPDPWPKVRHHKRRMISQNNLDEFARILKDNGQLIMTTDVDDLAGWMATQATNHPAFEWEAHSKDDWQKEPEGWVTTRYEQKGKEAGRIQTYLIFRKKA